MRLDAELVLRQRAAIVGRGVRPIAELFVVGGASRARARERQQRDRPPPHAFFLFPPRGGVDRKSTRLNSSHLGISYAVFCLKKKKQTLLNARSYDEVRRS